MLIVDSHAYCFPSLDAPAGHASGSEHMRWVQLAYAGHHQPAFRLRDRQRSNSDRQRSKSKVLAPPGRDQIGNLPDLNFRCDHKKGRLVWTIDGEDHTKYYAPPNLRNLEYTPHSLISEMDYADVDVALFHTDPSLIRDSAFLARCVQAYPDRLRSMAPVDEWRIPTESGKVIDELIASINVHKLHAIKFIPELTYMTTDQPWDDGPCRAFWQAATALKVPIFFTLGTRGQGIEGYLDEQRILMRWMDRYPDAMCSLTHGFPWRDLLQNGRVVLPPAIWEPFKNPKCHLEVCMPIRIGDLFDYPYREMWPALEQSLEHVGARQLLWGTDMPFQNRFCTYRQSRDWIENHCDFISKADLAQLMGGTAARLLSIKLPDEC
jgi:hypothetical protein